MLAFQFNQLRFLIIFLYQNLQNLKLFLAMKPNDLHNEIASYLKTQVHPIMSPIIEQLIKARPSNVLQFLKQYAQSKVLQSIGTLLQIETQNSITQSKLQISQQKKGNFPFKSMAVSKNKRNSISSSVFGVHNNIELHKSKLQIFFKSNQDCIKVKKLLKNSLVFTKISDLQLTKFIQIVQIKQFKKQQTFSVSQSLVIVRSGKFNYKLIDQKNEELINKNSCEMNKTCSEGETFAQLTLMYNTTSKIQLKSAQPDSSLYIMNKHSFKTILHQIKKDQQKQYLKMLHKLQNLTGISQQNRPKLLDIIEQKDYQKDQIVFVQKQQTTNLCIVLKGTFVSFNSKNQILETFKQSDFFSESCLCSPISHNYSVKCIQNDSILLLINGQKFTRTCGSLEEILKNSMNQYKALIGTNKNKRQSGLN